MLNSSLHLPLDFVLSSSVNVANRIQGVTKKNFDKRTCGYKHRQEAMAKSTEALEVVVRRVMAHWELGPTTSLWIDSWFCFASLIAKLSAHLPVICMTKDTVSNFYRYQDVPMRFGKLYQRLTKRLGKARIIASVVLPMLNGPIVKIVFVRKRKGKGVNANANWN